MPRAISKSQWLTEPPPTPNKLHIQIVQNSVGHSLHVMMSTSQTNQHMEINTQQSTHHTCYHVTN